MHSKQIDVPLQPTKKHKKTTQNNYKKRVKYWQIKKRNENKKRVKCWQLKNTQNKPGDNAHNGTAPAALPTPPSQNDKTTHTHKVRKAINRNAARCVYLPLSLYWRTYSTYWRTYSARLLADIQ